MPKCNYRPAIVSISVDLMYRVDLEMKIQNLLTSFTLSTNSVAKYGIVQLSIPTDGMELKPFYATTSKHIT